jgi:hypothetical protein
MEASLVDPTASLHCADSCPTRRRSDENKVLSMHGFVTEPAGVTAAMTIRVEMQQLRQTSDSHNEIQPARERICDVPMRQDARVIASICGGG